MEIGTSLVDTGSAQLTCTPICRLHFGRAHATTSRMSELPGVAQARRKARRAQSCCPSCRSGFRVSPNGNAPDDRDSGNDESDLSESQLPPRLNAPEPESHKAPIKKYKRHRKKKQKRGRLDRAPLAVRGFALLLVGGLAASFVYLRPQGSETVPATTATVSGAEQAGDSAPEHSATRPRLPFGPTRGRSARCNPEARISKCGPQ